MKYNKSEIMKKAWDLYRSAKLVVARFGETSTENQKTLAGSFSHCLKKAWAYAKSAVKEAEKRETEVARTGLRRMHYSEYKNSYSDCKTVEGSYDKKTKTIEVLTMVPKTARKAMTYIVNAKNGLCPRCGTYCYGDCTAALRG